MSILVNKDTKVLCQGITGRQATFHVNRSIEYGTNIVSGVTPSKGGTEHLGLPVFNHVKEAVDETGATASIMYVPAPFVKNATIEAIEAELDLIVCITDKIPVRDMMEINALLKGTKTKFIGPNGPGIITPDEARLGILPESIHTKGRIGVASRSSTLTYEAVIQTNLAGLGQSTVVGLGDDMVIGTNFVEIINEFMKDDETDAMVLIGQIGGTFEEEAAEYYKSLKKKKPIISFVAGDAIPFGHKIGYAGDVITKGKITVQDKREVMEASGMIVVERITSIHEELEKIFNAK